MNTVILASQSPRRRELMAAMGLDFQAIPSSYDEQLDESRDIEDVAIELSLGKAEDVARLHPEAYVIGSDTIVGIGGRQLGKAEDIDEARQMLLSLTGKTSTVTTGVAVVNLARNIRLTGASTSTVYFKPDSQEIGRLREEYLASGDWQDKAGAYGMQSGAASLIDKIEGDYDTIIGLSTRTLADLLTQCGIDAAAVNLSSPVPQVYPGTN